MHASYDRPNSYYRPIVHYKNKGYCIKGTAIIKTFSPFLATRTKKRERDTNPMITSWEEDDEEQRGGALGQRQSVPPQTEEHC
jgi:hypothetical protein